MAFGQGRQPAAKSAAAQAPAAPAAGAANRVGKFAGQGAARPAARPAARAPARRASRFAGIPSAQPREPQLDACAGVYRVRYVSSEVRPVNPRTGNETHMMHVEVVSAPEGGTPEGTTCTVMNVINGKSQSSGLSRVKAQTVAFAGHESDDTFDELDPEGGFIEACLGEANDFGADGDPLVGRLADVGVAQGNATKDGSDYYREYSFQVVPDDEQDVRPAFGAAVE